MTCLVVAIFHYHAIITWRVLKVFSNSLANRNKAFFEFVKWTKNQCHVKDLKLIVSLKKCYVWFFHYTKPFKDGDQGPENVFLNVIQKRFRELTFVQNTQRKCSRAVLNILEQTADICNVHAAHNSEALGDGHNLQKHELFQVP